MAYSSNWNILHVILWENGRVYYEWFEWKLDVFTEMLWAIIKNALLKVLMW